jgi:hypothetical protein
MRSSVYIKSAVIVQNVYEIKLVSHSNIIIVGIVGGSDLHGTGPERHVDDNVIRHYWDTTVHERMDSKLAVKVLWRQVSLPLRSSDKRDRLFTL